MSLDKHSVTSAVFTDDTRKWQLSLGDGIWVFTKIVQPFCISGNVYNKNLGIF